MSVITSYLPGWFTLSDNDSHRGGLKTLYICICNAVTEKAVRDCARNGACSLEALKCDLKQERTARPVLQEAIAHCESVKDYISREILADILEGEEEHIDWLETQIDLAEKLGLQNWLQSAAGSPS